MKKKELRTVTTLRQFMDSLNVSKVRIKTNVINQEKGERELINEATLVLSENSDVIRGEKPGKCYVSTDTSIFYITEHYEEVFKVIQSLKSKDNE